MDNIMVNIKSDRREDQYRVFVTTDSQVYRSKRDLFIDSVPYSPDTLLDEQIWFYIDDFSNSRFSLDILKNEFETVDYNSIQENEFEKIQYIFVYNSGLFYFQNVGKTKLLKRKGIFFAGNRYEYCEGYAAIQINEYPDALYDKDDDKLYFRNLSKITGIFPNINSLFREATDQEVKSFLELDFIRCDADFKEKNVSILNRKRITAAFEKINSISNDSKNKLFEYLKEYCPKIKYDNEKFCISSDKELTQLLYGLDERYYTTDIGGEKRIANSIIKIQ